MALNERTHFVIVNPKSGAFWAGARGAWTVHFDEAYKSATYNDAIVAATMAGLRRYDVERYRGGQYIGQGQ